MSLSKLSQKELMEKYHALGAAILRDIPLFHFFTDQQAQSLLLQGQILNFEPYMNVVIEGEASWGLYLIMDGIVGVSKSDRVTGGNYDIAELRKGSFFGEMSLLDDEPRSATVRTLTYCEFFYIGCGELNKFLNQDVDLKMKFYENCLKHLTKRLRDLGDSYIFNQYQLWRSAVRKDGSF